MKNNREGLQRNDVMQYKCTTLCENNEKPLQAYEAPKVEIIEVAIERGFAMSGDDGGYW